MIFPPLMPRMKQLGDSTSFGIDPREVRTFVKITVNASQSQVIGVVAAAMYPWDNMLDVKSGQWRVFLSKLAILAPIFGTFPHPRSERRTHPLRFRPSHLPRLPLKDGDEFVRPDIPFVLGPFFLRKLTFGRFGGQIFDPPLKLRVRLKTEDGFRFVRQNDLQDGANPSVERSAFWSRYHSRTISNTFPFRKRKKPLRAAVTVSPPGTQRRLHPGSSPLAIRPWRARFTQRPLVLAQQ